MCMSIVCSRGCPITGCGIGKAAEEVDQNDAWNKGYEQREEIGYILFVLSRTPEAAGRPDRSI